MSAGISVIFAGTIWMSKVLLIGLDVCLLTDNDCHVRTASVTVSCCHRPTVYVDVPSVDEAIRKVQAAGGKVVTPNTPIPGMGAYARVADTEGNVIGLFQSTP
jgi:hypothetical protein